MSKPTFEDQNLAGATFRNIDLSDAVFEDVNLSGARFENVRLHSAVAANVDLTQVRVTDASITGLTLDGREIGGSVAEEDPERKRLSAERVQEFVGVAHGDLERVRQLLAEEPKLLHAAWDWGGGDWETGLGAAAHMGRRDIAELLLAQGARLDIFAAAMLGKLEIVQAMLAVQPEARHAPGPHGIPLLAHARAGGAEAADVVAFLEGFPG